MGQVIQIERRGSGSSGEMVRGTVEETLNAMLDAEADRLCGADATNATRLGRILAGSYDRTLQTSAGEVNLKVRNCGARPSRLRSSNATAGGFGRGADRDVSGGDFSAAGGGHHRSPLGHAGEPEHGVEPQQEDLRQNRGVAGSAHRSEHPYLYPTAS